MLSSKAVFQKVKRRLMLTKSTGKAALADWVDLTTLPNIQVKR